MERLTTRCSGYAVMAWEHEEKYTTQEWIDMLTERLAAYEELMERWKLRSIEEADRIFQRVNALGGTDLMAQYRAIGSIDHLRDLLHAEQDGRLVVLPCKVGDTVYSLSYSRGAQKHFVAERKVEEILYCSNRGVRPCIICCFGGWRFDNCDIGKTVFLTREEAEEALQKGGTHETDSV